MLTEEVLEAILETDRLPRPRIRRGAMRVMVLVKATKDGEAGKPPSQELLAEMGKFDEQLVKAIEFLAPGAGGRVDS